MALNFPDNPTINQIYSDATAGFYYKWDGYVWQSYSPASSGNIKTLDDISSGFNGIGKTFSLTSGGVAIIPVNTSQLVINLGGIVQNPSIDYAINGSSIIFSESPETGLSFSGISLGPAVPLTNISSGTITPDKLSTGAPWWQPGYQVGIGTTLPTSALNVIGDGNFTGVITATTFSGQINSGFATITSAIVGAGVTINNAGIVAVGVITANTFVGNINGNVSGNVNGAVVGNINSTGFSTITNLITTSITSQNLKVTGITTLGSSNGIGTVTIGIGTTALFVSGNARVTGYLAIGTSSIIMDGIQNTISGVSTVTDASGGYLSIPPGTVISVASSIAPAGYLKANGAAISRTAYASLFAGIGTVHGAGDGSTTFNVPDLRGQFIRGWADNGSTDSGRTFGSSQTDDFKSHKHSTSIDAYSVHGYGINAGRATASGTDGPIGFSMSNTGGTETRPVNIALLHCIKY